MSDTNCIVTELVLASLRVHPSHTLSGLELQSMASATERQVRAAISALRRKGWMIVGDWGGYRFARDAAEVNAIIRRLEEQSRALQETAAVLRVASSLCFVRD